MDYTLTQTTAVSSSAYIDILKYAGAVLAGIAGIFRGIPAVAGYLARRKARVYNTRRLRMSKLERPAPWRSFEGWPAEWASEDYRRKYWRNYRILFGFLLVLLGFFCFLLLADAESHKHSLAGLIFLYVVAVLFGAVAIVLLKWIYELGNRHKECSPFRREITFAVRGTREDIFQYCYIALSSMGADVVEFDEACGTIVASIGLWIRNLYSGSELSVSVSSDQQRPGQMIIKMSSDEIGPSYMFGLFPPHARNVDHFLRQWNFSGLGQEETES